MPFVTKNPAYYLPALAEGTNAPLHVGLFLAGSFAEQRRADLVALGAAIRTSPRPIRCLWLRFKGESDPSLLDALRAFGDELEGASTVLSLVVEGRAGTEHVACLSAFFARNALRGLQFRRTDVDASTFVALRPFFVNAQSLRVLDLSSNPGVDDASLGAALGALLEGGTRLETLNVGEANLDDGPEEEVGRRISSEGVASIARFVSETRTLTSVTLRLRNLDDVNLGELSLPIRRKTCALRRLDLSGAFGNGGVKVLAEALKTNVSVRTITLGCHKGLTDAGGKALLGVVDPFSLDPPSELTDESSSEASAESSGESATAKKREWENVQRSNHTLQSVYLLDRPPMTVTASIVDRLRSISTADPHRTLQAKCWHHLEHNLDDVSHIELQSKHMPEALAFVHANGGLDALFRLVRSPNTPVLFDHPSPEKARLSFQMSKVEAENRLLKEALALERERGEDLHEENGYLRQLFHDKEEAKKCCLLPMVKLWEMWQLLVELIREPALSS